MRAVAAGIGAGMAVLTLAASSASATNLTFAINTSNSQPISQNYGDNVSSLQSGPFSYGEEGGFTPNVTVQYIAPSPPGGLIYRNSGYGDLQRVGWPNGDFMEIVFTAEEGFLVGLHGFDLAGLGADETASLVEVVDDMRGASLYSETDVQIEGDLSGPRHTSWDFDNPLMGQELTLRISGISNSGAVAIDNIVFSQVIPAPSTLGCLALGGLVATRRRR